MNAVYEVVALQYAFQIPAEWEIAVKQPDGTFERVYTIVYFKAGMQLQATNEAGEEYLVAAAKQGLLKAIDGGVPSQP